MKKKLINLNPRLKSLLFIFTLLFSFHSFAEESCEADAGTITADMDVYYLTNGSAIISATPNGDMYVPEGYNIGYALTQGDDLVIIDGSTHPKFYVDEPGNYIIHTLIYNPHTLDLGIVVPGTTTGFDVNRFTNSRRRHDLRIIRCCRCTNNG